MQGELIGQQGHDLCVPTHKEADFSARHTIELRRLSNGLTIIGVPFDMKGDVPSAEINVLFPSGAVSDPVERAGLHHLMEHLVLPPEMFEDRALLDVSVNAYTSIDRTFFHLSGVASPQVPLYGIWPVIPRFVNRIKNPLDSQDLPTELEREKGIVLREIAEGHFNGDSFQRKKKKLLLAPDNPYLINIIGSEEDVKSITADDVSALAQKILVPEGAIASVLSYGDPSICTEVVDKLEHLLNTLPSRRRQTKSIGIPLYGKMNKGFTPGQDFTPGRTFVFDNDHEVYSKYRPQRRTDFLWFFNNDQFATENMALNLFFTIYFVKMMNRMRAMGLTYSSESFAQRYGDNTMRGMHVILENREDFIPFIKDLRAEFAETAKAITRDELEQLSVNHAYQARILPMPRRSMLNILTEGLFHDGRVMDIDEIKKREVAVRLDHLRDVQASTIDQPATIIAI